MAWTFTFDTNSPANGDSPSLGAQKIRELKDALVERLSADHVFATAAGEVSADNSGMHTQITFPAPRATPDDAANFGFLYTKDSDDSKAELHFLDEDGDEIQLTANGQLNCPVDGSTIELDSGNGLQLKDDGVSGEKLKPDVADDSTIHLDNDELKIKVPAAVAEGSVSFSPVFIRGNYAGNGNGSRDIVVGATIRWLLIKCTTLSYTAVEAVNGSTSRAWAQANGNDMSDHVAISLTGASCKFTLSDNDNVNQAADTPNYDWVAICDRTT